MFRTLEAPTRKTGIMASTISELLLPSNLMSLLRIALAPPAAFFLSRNDATGTVAAVVVILVAAGSDGLDGYLARRQKQQSSLGILLDPFADKVFALSLVVSLVIFRQFPLWLAALIVGRDLLISYGALLLNHRRHLRIPSNLAGKYAFASVVTLLGAYVIDFQFSIRLMTPVVVILSVVSLVSYIQQYRRAFAGEPTPAFADSRAFRTIRIVLTALVAIAHVVMFYVEKLS